MKYSKFTDPDTKSTIIASKLDARDTRLAQGLWGSLVALLLWSPLPFGSVEAWSKGLLEVAGLLIFMVAAIGLIYYQNFPVNRDPIQWPMLALLVLGATQVLLTTNGIMPLTKDLPATVEACWLLAVLTALFLLMSNLITLRRAKNLLHLLSWWGAIIALFAIVQQVTANGKLYWFQVLRYDGYFFGPFVNRNHAAGFLAMLFPLPLVMLLMGSVRREQTMYAILATVIAVAIVVSGSRGGALALIAELGFLGLILLISHRKSRPIEALSLLGIVSVAVVTVSWLLGPQRLLQRLNDSLFNEAQQEYGRLTLWQKGWQIFTDHPLTGIGLGAYEAVYPQYDPANGRYRTAYAHNDYLQLLTDCGILGGIVGLCFLGLLLLRGLPALREHYLYELLSRHRSISPAMHRALILAPLTAIVGIGVHSLFDFNLQIPSNALLLLMLVAILSEAAASAA
jgi:O-antigen ligase